MAGRTLKVAVKLLVTVDLDAYREAYGDDPPETIREDIRQAASDGIRAVISQGIRDTEVK